jgi:hypothetical protein
MCVCVCVCVCMCMTCWVRGSWTDETALQPPLLTALSEGEQVKVIMVF